MIDPNAINTIRVGQLVEAVFSGTDNIPHEVGTDLRRGTIADLATYVAGVIESTGGLAFLPISVTDGQELPPTTANEWFLAGKGTYTQTGGYPDIICVEGLNVIIGNGVNWSLGVGVPIIVDPPAAMISQTVTEGVTNYSPSENAVYTHSLGKENISNKVSEIINYSEVLYPNEKATHDALDLKLNISDLPTNLTLYPTNIASDVVDYVKLVTDIHDTDYNTVAVDISTPTITTTDQLVASLISDAGVLIGHPGVFNATTFGNIRRLSGTGTATFYFKVFHRNLAGTETLIGTSSNTDVVTSSSYLEFTAALLWDDGTFIDTDRIVIKYYANRIAGNSDPVYQFQFGGSTPVRTLLPVPFSVVDAGYELKINKQNSLTVDGTGVKYPTVDAVNTGLATKQNTLTNPVTGTGTTNTISKWTGSTTQGNSNISDNGTLVTISTDANINGINTGRGAGNISTNTAFGFQALLVNTSGNNNSAVGYQSLAKNTTGNFNTGLGNASAFNNLIGNDNSFFGYQSGYTSTSSFNCFFGSASGYNSTGSSNNFFGYRAALNLVTGGNNIILGAQAARFISDGVTNLTSLSDSVVIGTSSKPLGNSQTNQVIIGHNTTGLGSNSTVLGNSSTVFGRWWGRLLLGTSTDNSVDQLQVNGTISATAGTTASQVVVKSQLDGKVSLTGNETIAGVKTFSSGILSNSLATVSSDQLTLTSGSTSLTIDDTDSTTTASGDMKATNFIRTTSLPGQLLKADGNVTVGYKVYTALVSQSGTSAPTATVLENTLGGTVVWTRASTGNYHGTLTGAFVTSKTTIQITGNFSNVIASAYRSTSDLVVFMTSSSGALSDTGITNGTIEIRVYN